MFKKILSSVFIFLAVVVAPAASAHVLKTDGEIGAVLHVDPNDDPVAGQPATFLFELKDKTGKFQSKNCDCNAYITENGKQIFQIKLFGPTTKADENTPIFTYTFPERNVYQVEFAGKAVDGSFQDFSLKYDIRVDKGTGAPLPKASGTGGFWSKNGLYVGLFGAAFLVILFLYRREKKKEKSGGNKPTPPQAAMLSLLAGVAFTGFVMHGTLLDGVLAFHHHPVHAEHQCCQAGVALFEEPVVGDVVFHAIKVSDLLIYSYQKEFNLLVSNKSPPEII